jgi:hypothetical protein
MEKHAAPAARFLFYHTLCAVAPLRAITGVWLWLHAFLFK